VKLARVAMLLAAAACALARPAIGQSGTRPSGFTAFTPVQVPPIARSEYANLIDGGALETDGWTYLVLNLAAEMKGPVPGGNFGVVLIPDLQIFRRAFQTLGILPASLEYKVPVAAGAPTYFLAPQQRFEIGFPRYRIYYYNETGQGATLNLFAYRTR